MFAGLGFGGYVVSILIAWLIQREVVKSNVQLSETMFIIIFLPIANVILSAIFWFAKEKGIDAAWIKKNFYQIK